jgi:2-polyprenyl-3-methyl-5-hydroxy-6-metoxy-1,4-benzoquinol methylase
LLYPDLARFGEFLEHSAPLLVPSFTNQRHQFGQTWEEEFNDLLGHMIAGDDFRLKQAVEGYVGFILDGMRLQKAYERTRRYASKTYAEAAEQVYLNPGYMHSRYLPGLILSHYLWPHHYRQRIFFQKSFVSLIGQSRMQQFCDIGIGTGFYSRLVLTSCRESLGWAYDISTSALSYGRTHLAAYGVSDRWTSEIRDIVADPPTREWPFLLNVEVLEHLEDPLTFLRALRAMLAPGGFAFIAAAVTAAERDHIYLYESANEVKSHLEAAGFRVVDEQEDKAYASDGDRPVPGNAAFLVTTR